MPNFPISLLFFGPTQLWHKALSLTKKLKNGKPCKFVFQYVFRYILYIFLMLFGYLIYF